MSLAEKQAQRTLSTLRRGRSKRTASSPADTQGATKMGKRKNDLASPPTWTDVIKKRSLQAVWIKPAEGKTYADVLREIKPNRGYMIYINQRI